MRSTVFRLSLLHTSNAIYANESFVHLYNVRESSSCDKLNLKGLGKTLLLVQGILHLDCFPLWYLGFRPAYIFHGIALDRRNSIHVDYMVHR